MQPYIVLERQGVEDGFSPSLPDRLSAITGFNPPGPLAEFGDGNGGRSVYMG